MGGTCSGGTLPGKLGESAEIDMFLESRFSDVIVSRGAAEAREEGETSH